MQRPTLFTLASAALALALSSCTDEAPRGLRSTPDGGGPTVRFDLAHRPLPEIPIPNDVATWPDPTSRTGLRINASLWSSTWFEYEARWRFDRLEGWGTYAPLTVAFDKRDPTDRRAAIDLANVARRHQGDDYDFADDVLYVVDLETGVPAPLDLGEGSFDYTVLHKDAYWANDPRLTEGNLVTDTADERVDPATGRLDPERTHYEPRWDTDFDGVLDTPNLLNPKDPDDLTGGCPNQAQVTLGQVTELDRDRCLADRLLTWYERETDTLVARPLVPLEGKREYAVVLMDRLVDRSGNAVRSPFGTVYHPSQEASMRRLRSHLRNPELKEYWGDYGAAAFDHVAFAWSFTTQPTVDDLLTARDGLYGKGPLARLAEDFEPKLRNFPLVGPKVSGELPAGWTAQPKCKPKAGNIYSVTIEELTPILKAVGSLMALSPVEASELLASLQAVSHVVVGDFESPFLISGGPAGTDPGASFEMDFETGRGELHRDRVQVLALVPKPLGGHHQPFPVTYYGHGYTGNFVTETLGFGGNLAQQGIALVGMNAPFHGFSGIPPAMLQPLFENECLGPLATALQQGRARDLNADGAVDSGGDYWTSYLFHTRDVVRQSALDALQMMRVFKSFDGKRRGDVDFDGDGRPELAGDFDADGVPDLGGPGPRYGTWGQSLGGIISPIAAALDPDVVAAAPGSGAGGLLDVGVRTFQGGAFEGIYLRNFGPLMVGIPNPDPATTRCTAGQVSLRFTLIDVNTTGDIEFGCADASLFAKGGTVIVHNADNGEASCARVTSDGRFRVSIPASAGDELWLDFFDAPDVVGSYDGAAGCHTPSGLVPVLQVSQWGKGLAAQNTQSSIDTCLSADGCTRFQGVFYEAGNPLRTPVEGPAYLRQTPGMRRFMNLAAHVVDPGDPINYVRLLGLAPPPGPDGKPHPAKGLLNIVTVGDMNVPISAGIAMGRAAGALPFLAPEAAARYPELLDYVTPDRLYADLGGRTPNRVLIDLHVVEGINRLARHPPQNGCGANLLPVASQPSGCTAAAGAQVPADQCQDTLADADVLDEGLSLWGDVEAAVPVRSARASLRAAGASAAAVWAPRLLGVPYAADQGAWDASQPVLAQIQAYTTPLGEHGYYIPNACQHFSMDRYMVNLVAHFFGTSGKDVYYLSHPATHQCLAHLPGDGACDFIQIPPASSP